jgi:hypothetical protein
VQTPNSSRAPRPPGVVENIDLGHPSGSEQIGLTRRKKRFAQVDVVGLGSQNTNRLFVEGPLIGILDNR